MIPKIIHYCWFGKSPMNRDALRFIESWKKYCPDYQLMLWDEERFDVSRNAYTREAYENRKWAFVTDYVRLFALYHYGGIYMDCDVEVVKSLDPFLKNRAFSGFEKYDAVPTGIMASEKGLPVIGRLLDSYRDRHFVLPDGSFDLHTNVEDMTAYFTERGLLLNNEKQTVEEFTFYPKDYFCPLDNRTYEMNRTENTAAIHHFAGSWIEDPKKLRQRKIKKLIGPRLTALIVRFRRRFIR